MLASRGWINPLYPIIYIIIIIAGAGVLEAKAVLGTLLYLGAGLPRIVRARYEGGVLKPLEPLRLEDGVEVILELRRASKVGGLEGFFGIIESGGAPSTEEEYYEYVSERGHVP